MRRPSANGYKTAGSIMIHRRTLFIAADHPAFTGHFPERPIAPGVLLLDLALRAITAELDLATEPLWQISVVKFLGPALPGDTVILAWESTHTGEIRFTIERDTKPLTKGIVHHTPP